MTYNKIFCTTHRLYHQSAICPLCEKERISRLAENYKDKEAKPKDREINEDDITKLIKKFNDRHA